MAVAAAVLALAWFAIHLVLGGREVARPLRDDRSLPETARAVAWICWHFMSVTLLAMGAPIGVGALAGRSDLVLAGALLAAGFAAAGVILPPLMGWSYRTAPQGWLFLPVAAPAPAPGGLAVG